MTVASIVGLLKPGFDEGSALAVVAGFAVGVVFLLVARTRVNRSEIEIGGRTGPGARLSVLVFLVLFVHSFPEGFSIGTAYASDVSGLSLFVILAIGLQNVPEGTSVAVPMDEAGYSHRQQFWAAVLTSVPQPVGAVIAYLLVRTFEDLLAVSFGFAAGAMLSLVASDLAPRALRGGGAQRGTLGALAGAAVDARIERRPRRLDRDPGASSAPYPTALGSSRGASGPIPQPCAPRSGESGWCSRRSGTRSSATSPCRPRDSRAGSRTC